MEPTFPVVTDVVETVAALTQPEYTPLPVVQVKPGMMTSRWKLDESDRLLIAERGDVLVTQCTFGQPLQPLWLLVAPGDLAGWQLAEVLPDPPAGARAPMNSTERQALKLQLVSAAVARGWWVASREKEYDHDLALAIVEEVLKLTA